MLDQPSREDWFRFLSFQQTSKRKPSFLRRNVRKTLRSLTDSTMGNHISKATHIFGTTRDRQIEHLESEDEKEHPESSVLVGISDIPMILGSKNEDEHLSKRRKIYPSVIEEIEPTHIRSSLRNPLDLVTNGSTRLPVPSKAPPDTLDSVQRPQTTPIIQAHTIPKPRHSERLHIDNIVNPEPVEHHKALRVDILEITSKAPLNDFETDLRDHLAKSDNAIEIKCKCRVAIFYDCEDNTKNRDYVQLCESVKLGFVRVATDPTEMLITRELIFADPFVFGAEEFFINRRRKHHSGSPELDIMVGLAKRYQVQCTLEPLGYQEHWGSLLNVPPLDTPDSEITNQISNVLYSEESDIIANDIRLEGAALLFHGTCREYREVNLNLIHRQLLQPSPHKLRMKLNWSLPSRICALPTPRVETSQTACTGGYNIQNKTHSSRIDRTRGSSRDPRTVSLSPCAKRSFDAMSTDNLPSDRSLRKKVHIPGSQNLRLLSAQAQGRSPRKPRTPKPARDDDHDNENMKGGICIEYAFGRADSAENGISPHHTVQGLKCPFCCVGHRSIDELKLHLHGEHHSYKFHVRRKQQSRMTFFVEIIRNHSSPDSKRSFQMTRTRTLFDLNAYLEGDDNWSNNRGICEPKPPGDRRRDQKSSSCSPFASDYSSPDTSNSVHDSMDIDADKEVRPLKAQVKSPTKAQPKPRDQPLTKRRKLCRVPQTSKPLYDVITKRILKPGEEIPCSDDEKDETWFHQKHRDILNDFSDVTADEKDYIGKWNPFIVDQKLSSELYLPKTVVKFVEQNKSWFVRKASRKSQFIMQMEVFIMRGVVNEDCLHKCFDILREESSKKSNEDVEMEDAEDLSPPKHRGILDCICLEHTRPPNRVVCHGKNCKGRYFHRECAVKHGRPVTGKWICDVCVSS